MAPLPATTCTAATETGTRCRQYPMQGSTLCFWHNPTTATDAAEARRLGGLRRRREHAVAGAYDLGELDSVGQIRRLLQVTVLDTLSLENSVARSRALAYLAVVAVKLLETGELETRIAMLEAAVQQQSHPADSVFDATANEIEVSFIEGESRDEEAS